MENDTFIASATRQMENEYKLNQPISDEISEASNKTNCKSSRRTCKHVDHEGVNQST